MQFWNNHKVIPKSLTRDEAEDFDSWLSDEYWRHDLCVMELCDQVTSRPLIADILKGAIKRHQKEIESTVSTRRILKELFGL